MPRKIRTAPTELPLTQDAMGETYVRASSRPTQIHVVDAHIKDQWNADGEHGDASIASIACELLAEPVNTVVAGDPVNHPSHYTSHPSGVEAITITEGFGFVIGNAIKYLWRAGLKGNSLEDLKKARWYVDRAIANKLKEIAERA